MGHQLVGNIDITEVQISMGYRQYLLRREVGNYFVGNTYIWGCTYHSETNMAILDQYPTGTLKHPLIAPFPLDYLPLIHSSPTPLTFNVVCKKWLEMS